MTIELTGKHLIAGQWIGSDQKFHSSPTDGDARAFSVGTGEDVDKAVQAAEKAFWSFGYSARSKRAELLNAIADEIEARGEALTEIGCQETGLPETRLNGERGRTTGQLRSFADHILKGDYLDQRFDGALPDRQPLPRPELRMVQRPLGPVAVFGASNFPLAFSTAGGDTASALAAGCPVVVKGHPAHPGTGEIVAQAIDAAIQRVGVDAGVFSFIHSDGIDVGVSLVTHPLINAVGFTGSLGAGRALFELCANRPTPIPFYGELGSINPMFLLPAAVKARTDEIAEGWANSLVMGAGQFCTNPGVAVVLDGADADKFEAAAIQALSQKGSQVMLTEGIAQAFQNGIKSIAKFSDIKELVSNDNSPRSASPQLYAISGKNWLSNSDVREEVFGPFGIIVRAANFEEMLEIARELEGQLTCTLHLDGSDNANARALLPILERKAGRILANGYPTGVEVCDSMVHGGPYPASTNFGATSVGTLSIRRFIRPVCYQNIPSEILASVYPDIYSDDAE